MEGSSSRVASKSDNDPAKIKDPVGDDEPKVNVDASQKTALTKEKLYFAPEKNNPARAVKNDFETPVENVNDVDSLATALHQTTLSPNASARVSGSPRNITEIMVKNIYTVNVRNPNMFGFQTCPHHPVLNLFEQLKRLKSEQNWFERSDFGHFG